MKLTAKTTIAIIATLICGTLFSAEVTLTEKGILCDTGKSGSFTISYPLLEQGNKRFRPLKVTVKGNKAHAKFANGASVEIDKKADGLINFIFSSVPEGIKKFRMDSTFPLSISNGGTWSFDGSAPRKFPVDPKKGAFLFKNNAKKMELRFKGKGYLGIRIPFGWQQLQDNREWKTDNFYWFCANNIPQAVDGKSYFSIAVAVTGQKLAKFANFSTPKLKKSEKKAVFSLNNKGIVINHGADGSFNIAYPVLIDSQNKANKILEIKISGKKATITYVKGGTLNIKLKGDDVALSFSNVPADTKKFKCSMIIPSSYKDGGTWDIGSEKNKSFPKEKPATPQFYRGTARNLEIVSQHGVNTSITIPEFSYQQLQDNREWGWQVYQWQFWTPYNFDHPNYTISLSGKTDTKQAGAFRVDRFGQAVKANIVNRVYSEKELKKDVETEKAYYAGFKPPKFDRFGGLPGSGEKMGLKKTGFFHVEKKSGRWILVNPDGNAFFHLGICCFIPYSYTYIAGRESIFEWIPPRDGNYKSVWQKNPYWNPTSPSFHLANMVRKYNEPADIARFQNRMIDRVRKWGFNSIGAFSSVADNVVAKKNFPYVASLPGAVSWGAIKPLPGIKGTFDVFDENNWIKYEKKCQKTLPKLADNPLIIGFYLVNEPTHEAVPRVVPTLKNIPVKKRLVKFLREKYKTIDAYNAAWNSSAGNFDELTGKAIPVNTKKASKDMEAFSGLFFETYFRRIREIFKKYNKNHMLIGCRWQPSTANNKQLCGIAGKYMDIISLNYYTYGVDKEYLDRIYKWCGEKPMFLSEFYWTSSSDSGVGSFKDVSSQKERGLAYRNYVEQAAALGYVVGIEWFTLTDGPVTGHFFSKYNGERPNSGLFSVTDRPWKTMIAEMVKTNYDIYKFEFDGKKPFVFDDPRFTGSGGGTRKILIAKMPDPVKIDGERSEWPGLPGELISGKRLVEGPDAGELEGNFRLGYDDKNLYIYVEVTDHTPMRNKQTGKMLWSGDGLEIFIGPEKIDDGGSLKFEDRQLLIGAGKAEGQFWAVNAPEQFKCDITVISRGDGKSYVIEAAIPFEKLGFKPKPGKEILFDLAIDNSHTGKGRKTQIMWNGIARNSSDRSAWGRAVFGEGR